MRPTLSLCVFAALNICLWTVCVCGFFLSIFDFSLIRNNRKKNMRNSLPSCDRITLTLKNRRLYFVYLLELYIFFRLFEFLLSGVIHSETERNCSLLTRLIMIWRPYTMIHMLVLNPLTFWTTLSSEFGWLADISYTRYGIFHTQQSSKRLPFISFRLFLSRTTRMSHCLC